MKLCYFLLFLRYVLSRYKYLESSKSIKTKMLYLLCFDIWFLLIDNWYFLQNNDILIMKTCIIYTRYECMWLYIRAMYTTKSVCLEMFLCIPIKQFDFFSFQNDLLSSRTFDAWVNFFSGISKLIWNLFELIFLF